jgi:CRP-like cAMP-binding protein
MVDPAYLKSAPLFQSLPEELLRELAQACRTRTYRRGDVLFYEEDEANALYLLRSGKVKIVRLGEDGEERILFIHRAGECLGELSLVDGKPRSAKAEAMEPVEAVILSRQPFLDLIEREPAVARGVMSALAGMVRRLSEQVQEFATLNVAARLARRLLQLADMHGQSTPQGIRFALPLSQDELAGMIGTTRQTVNTQLQKFQQAGILTADREGITLHQPQKLRRAVEAGTRAPT